MPLQTTIPCLITAAKLNHNSKILVTGDVRGNVNFYNSNLEFVTALEGDKQDKLDLTGVTAITFNSNSKYLAFAQLSGSIRIIDMKNSTLVREIKVEKCYATSLVFNNSDNYLVYGTSLGSVVFFNLLNSGSNKINQFCMKYCVS